MVTFQMVVVVVVVVVVLSFEKGNNPHGGRSGLKGGCGKVFSAKRFKAVLVPDWYGDEGCHVGWWLLLLFFLSITRVSDDVMNTIL